jgi:hypothetical protein
MRNDIYEVLVEVLRNGTYCAHFRTLRCRYLDIKQITLTGITTPTLTKEKEHRYKGTA